MFFTAAPGLLITLQITYFFRRTYVSGRAIHTTSFIYELDSSFFRAKITLNNKGGHGNKFPTSTALFFLCAYTIIVISFKQLARYFLATVFAYLPKKE